jgi:hypothetical protein
VSSIGRNDEVHENSRPAFGGFLARLRPVGIGERIPPPAENLSSPCMPQTRMNTGENNGLYALAIFYNRNRAIIRRRHRNVERVRSSSDHGWTSGNRAAAIVFSP